MKPRSAKAKGRKFQDEIKQLIHVYFPELDDDDVKTAIMGENGLDLHLSGAAKKLIPFAIEATNTEKLNVWKKWDQAQKNCPEKLNAALAFRRNRSKPMVVIEFETWLWLLWKIHDLEKG